MKSDSDAGWLSPLYILSIFYRGIIGLRNFMYESGMVPMNRLNCKVISVGNITVGGTGKTPTVIKLATLLREKGYRPAVLSRGYKGRKKRQVNIVSDGAHILMSPQEAGDEPALIAQSVDTIPVLTGKRRYITGRYAVEHFGANVLILDDAFQHRSLMRDIDIVLLDEQRPLGNGFVLPRGELREPPRALRRADIVLLTGSEKGDSPVDIDSPNDQHRKSGSYLSDKPMFRAYRKPRDFIKGITKAVYPLDYIKGKKIVAFAGIADPDAFRRTIMSIGGQIVGFIPFPDHHSYRSDDIAAIREAISDASADIVITTGKDGIKLIDFPELLHDVFILRIDMAILPAGGSFESLIMELLEK